MTTRKVATLVWGLVLLALFLFVLLSDQVRAQSAVAASAPSPVQAIRVRVYATDLEARAGEEFPIILEVANQNVPGSAPLRLANSPLLVRQTEGSPGAKPKPSNAADTATVTIVAIRPATRYMTGGSGPSPTFSGTSEPFVTVQQGKSVLAKFGAGWLLVPGENVIKLVVTYNGEVVAESKELHIRCASDSSSTSQPATTQQSSATQK